ncbi:uncharacterized protein [Henckelia pumila]|uniref:uncharacterized protein n=1 Tax=Henckelia pumila TaxID=405737 RepID=UPI003C6E582D
MRYKVCFQSQTRSKINSSTSTYTERGEMGGSTPVYVVITILGIIAFSLSIAGERHRSTGTLRTDTVTNQTYCIYKTDAATGLAVVACLLLFAAQVTLMVVTRCLCCGPPLAPGGSRACTIILFIVMWISYFMAEACLIAAARDYAYYDGYRTAVYTSDTNAYSCATLRRALFVAGAIFTVSTTILNLLYYKCFTRASAKHIQQGGYPGNSNIGMATRG